MVPYVDMEIITHVKRTVGNLASVVWAPADSARQLITRKADEEHENLPGIAVFRTGTEADTTRANTPEAARGYILGYEDDDETNVPNALAIMQRRKNVVAQYNLSIFARKQTEMANIERKLWFFDTYNPTVVTRPSLSGEGGTEFVFPIQMADPSYTQHRDEDSGKLTLFQIDWSFTVPTFWVQNEKWRTAFTLIETWYAVLTGGDPVTDKTDARHATANEEIGQFRIQPKISVE